VKNHKRTERLYKEEKLSLKLRKRKTKRVSELRAPLSPATKPNERWSMDFIHARLYQGRRFKSLTIVDDCTRESPAIEVDTSIPGIRVMRVLDRLKETRGLPKVIVVDNGPEFSGKVLDDWAWRNGVKLDFIDPGRPQQNAYIESFNATFRKDCLNKNWFYTLNEAEDAIEKWRNDYNEFRPHDSLDDLTPSEFMKRIALTQNQQESNFQVAQLTG
jgi:putative transposase